MIPPLTQPSENEGRRPTSLLQGAPSWTYTVAVLIIYGLLAIVMTWPLVSRLSTHWPGGHEDVLVYRWTYWWVRQAIMGGENPYYTYLLFHPNGVSLTAHGGIAWLNILFWILLQPLVGDIAAFNLFYFVAFTLNGFALYLLAYEWTKSRPAAFISGLIRTRPSTIENSVCRCKCTKPVDINPAPLSVRPGQSYSGVPA